MTMKDIKEGLQTFLFWTKIVLVLLGIGVIIYIVIRVKHLNEPLVELTTTNTEAKLSFSPEQIQSIEDIGEWVFLTVEAEELVDTVRKRTFVSDDVLSRIYTGTLMYGLDFHERRGKEWIFVREDNVLEVYLPSIKLIDRKFINEAKTRTFYQSGSWDSQDMKALYNKAQRRMMKRFHTQQNIDKAKENAQRELTKFFQAYGYSNVKLVFD